ncbi:MAG: hypothetical protein ACXWNK_16475 [Vulcanimicrobiaceae bacterium]
MALVAHPGWILLILCALAVLLVLVSLIPVVRTGLALTKHLKRLTNAPLFAQLESLRASGDRIRASAEQAKPLAGRAQVAVASIRRNVRESGIPQIVAGIKTAGLAIRLIVHELG